MEGNCADKRWGRPGKLLGARRSGREHMTVSFWVVSDVIMQCFVVLTTLAASCHLAYDFLSLVSFSVCWSTLAGAPEKNVSLGPETFFGGLGEERDNLV